MKSFKNFIITEEKNYKELIEDDEIQILLKDIKETLKSKQLDEFISLVNKIVNKNINSNEAHKLYFILEDLESKCSSSLNKIKTVKKMYQKFMDK